MRFQIGIVNKVARPNTSAIDDQIKIAGDFFQLINMSGLEHAASFAESVGEIIEVNGGVGEWDGESIAAGEYPSWTGGWGIRASHFATGSLNYARDDRKGYRAEVFCPIGNRDFPGASELPNLDHRDAGL